MRDLDRASVEKSITRSRRRSSLCYRDDRGRRLVGISFNLDRPDASLRLAEIGVDYNAICNGSQALTDSQIDALLANEVSAAIAHAQTRVCGFQSLEPTQQLVVLGMIYDLGPFHFSEFMQRGMLAHDVDRVTSGQAEPDVWFR